MRFKIGDRVISNIGNKKGLVGMVKRTLRNFRQDPLYTVRWEDGTISTRKESYLDSVGQESLQAGDGDAGQQAVVNTYVAPAQAPSPCTYISMLSEPDIGCPFHSARRQLSARDLLKEKLSRTFGILRQEPRTRADLNRAHMAKGDRR